MGGSTRLTWQSSKIPKKTNVSYQPTGWLVERIRRYFDIACSRPLYTSSSNEQPIEVGTVGTPLEAAFRGALFVFLLSLIHI